MNHSQRIQAALHRLEAVNSQSLQKEDQQRLGVLPPRLKRLATNVMRVFTDAGLNPSFEGKPGKQDYHLTIRFPEVVQVKDSAAVLKGSGFKILSRSSGAEGFKGFLIKSTDPVAVFGLFEWGSHPRSARISWTRSRWTPVDADLPAKELIDDADHLSNVTGLDLQVYTKQLGLALHAGMPEGTDPSSVLNRLRKSGGKKINLGGSHPVVYLPEYECRAYIRPHPETGELELWIS